KQLKVLFDTLLSLPTVVVGLVVYGLLSKNGPFGGYGLIYSLSAIIIAQTILILPIVIALTSSAIENADERMYIALKSYGLKGIKFFLATIYEIRIMIIMAIITAWARAFSEVGASIIVGGNIKWKTRTITTAIALEATRGNFARAIALGVVLLAIALLINILLHIYKKRV
ncbi:MAG: ABC transporter permease, partial [Spirochaetes bacterium]